MCCKVFLISATAKTALIFLLLGWPLLPICHCCKEVPNFCPPFISSYHIIFDFIYLARCCKPLPHNTEQCLLTKTTPFGIENLPWRSGGVWGISYGQSSSIDRTHCSFQLPQIIQASRITVMFVQDLVLAEGDARSDADLAQPAFSFEQILLFNLILNPTWNPITTVVWRDICMFAWASQSLTQVIDANNHSLCKMLSSVIQLIGSFWCSKKYFTTGDLNRCLLCMCL